MIFDVEKWIANLEHKCGIENLTIVSNLVYTSRSRVDKLTYRYHKNNRYTSGQATSMEDIQKQIYKKNGIEI